MELTKITESQVQIDKVTIGGMKLISIDNIEDLSFIDVDFLT